MEVLAVIDGNTLVDYDGGMKVKLAFYPSPDVKKILKDVPQGKLSARVNALILKGSEKEKDELRSEWRKRAFAEYAESSPEDLFSD